MYDLYKVNKKTKIKRIRLQRAALNKSMEKDAMSIIIANLNFMLLSSLKPVIKPINAFDRKNTLAQVTSLSIVRKCIKTKP